MDYEIYDLDGEQCLADGLSRELALRCVRDALDIEEFPYTLALVEVTDGSRRRIVASGEELRVLAGHGALSPAQLLSARLAVPGLPE